MSELKEVMNVMQVSGERIPSGYYKKCEVDAVLAEQDKEIAELKEQVHEYALGSYVMQARAEKETRHHKYKRCVAMVEMLEHICPMTVRKAKWKGKWHIYWLALAEKFKEAK